MFIKEGGVRARAISPSPLSHFPFTGPKRANPAIRFWTPGPPDRPGPVKKNDFYAEQFILLYPV